MSIVQDLPDMTPSGPFRSAVPLGRRDDAMPVQPGFPDRLSKARVTDSTIPDGRPFSLPPMARIVVAADTPLILMPSLPRGAAGRPIARQVGLRLMPLEGFVWGTRHLIPKPRTRSDHCLLWVTRGALQVDFPRRRQVLGPGEVRFIPAGTAFSTLPLGGAEGMVLLVSIDMARSCSPAFPNQIVAGNIGAAAPVLLATLTDLALESEAERGRKTSAMTCHLSLLAIRLERMTPSEKTAPRDLDRPADPGLVQRFLVLALDQLGSGRTLGELAEDLGVNSATLDRACVAARGRRAIELIHDLRHERAVDALRNTTRPTDRIAKDLGYSSVAHFIRAFVAATGRLPELFRADGKHLPR